MLAQVLNPTTRKAIDECSNDDYDCASDADVAVRLAWPSRGGV